MAAGRLSLFPSPFKPNLTIFAKDPFFFSIPLSKTLAKSPVRKPRISLCTTPLASQTLRGRPLIPSISPSSLDLEPYLKCSMPGERLKVAVLLSGGVDSSVALRLLHAAGHSCTAFYLKIWFQVSIVFNFYFWLRWRIEKFAKS